MPSDQALPAASEWRGQVPQLHRKRHGLEQPEWRKEEQAFAATGGRSRLVSRFIFGAVTLAALAILLVLVARWFRPHHPAHVVLVGADYLFSGTAHGPLAIPHNYYGWQGLTAIKAQLADLFPEIDPPVAFRHASGWDQHLGEFEEDTLILFLALHGNAGEGLGPYLLPQDADILDSSTYLRFEAVLDRLEKMDQENPYGKKNKLLILDATQVPAAWSQGTLHNDFARALSQPQIRERIDRIHNLTILCASAADQRSWVSDVWRTTIFTHYVIEGLRGAADVYGDQNGRVDGFELYRYVHDHVMRWVRENRDELQTPMLLGSADVEARARAMILAVTPEYQAPDGITAPDVQTPANLGVLKELWQARQRLEKETPPPWTYAPHLWRQYQDTLLLYEQLVRAGGQDQAVGLKNELDLLLLEIHAAQRLELPCQENTLTLPQALGLVLPWTDPVTAESNLTDLWKASSDERQRKWQEIQKKVSDEERFPHLLRTRLSGLLIERAAAAPGDNLQKAVQLLADIGATGNRRTAETHFLAMLRRDLDANQQPSGDLIAHALRVRLLAENAALATPRTGGYPYSEYAFPWIADRIATADGKRAHAQDLLFATLPQSWQAADELFKVAEREYRAVRADGELIGKAVALCQEVESLAPYLARWWAGKRAEDRAYLNQMAQLWQQTQALEDWLEIPKTEFKTLTTRLDKLEDTFRQLKTVFRARCQLDQAPNSALVSVRRDIDEVLAVPTIDADLRVVLLQKAQYIAHALHRSTAMDLLSRNAPEVAEDDQKQQHQMAQQAAIRQGRMALAMLGPRLYDTEANFTRDGQELSRLTDENWTIPLDRIGAKIGRAWRRLPAEANRLTSEAQRGEPSRALKTAERAERLTRQLDDATLSLLQGNPAQVARRLRLAQLLMWQAQRTLNEHWFAEDPFAEPYYRDAGSLYLRDARVLLGGNRREQFTAAEYQKRFQLLTERDAQVNAIALMEARLAHERQQDVTSEPDLALDFRLTQTALGLPAGHPVVWFTPDRFLRAREPAGRRTLQTDGKQPVNLAPYKLDLEPVASPPIKPQIDVTRVVLQGLFRGQQFTKTVPVNLHRLPEIVAYQHPDVLSPGVAVRADPAIHARYAPANGALAIVLDCSGSMGVTERTRAREGFQYTRETPCKYHEATTALRRTLEQLDPGVTVSVHVFSQVVGRQNDKGEALDKQPEPEETIEQIRAPAPWNRAQLNALMEQLESLSPYNKTPLVRAIWKAKRDAFHRGKTFDGFKTMMVITDGEDNRFKQDAFLQQQHTSNDIPEFLKYEFDRDGGVILNLVGFKVLDEEAQALTDQFKNAIEKRLPLRGKFYTVDDAPVLTTWLRAHMQPRLRFEIDPENSSASLLKPMPEAGWDLGKSEQGDHWVPLSEGDYLLRLRTTQVVQQPVQIRKGDFLLVNVAKEGQGMERVLLGREPSFRNNPHFENATTLWTLLQEQFKWTDESLELLAALEHKNIAPRGQALQQPRPRRIWFEVEPQEDPAPISLRWGPIRGYAAPTWTFNIAAWPIHPEPRRPVVAEVRAWWSWDNSEAGRVDSVARPANTELEKAFQDREPQIGPNPEDKATLESVHIETRHDVVFPPGQPPHDVSCLVVRLRFPRDPAIKAVWVEPEGIQAQNVEHRFYLKAGKYTGVFWPVPAEDAEKRLTGFQVYSVDKLKSQAAGNSFDLKLTRPPNRLPRPASIPELIELK